MKRRILSWGAALAGTLLVLPGDAWAARFLFVSDVETDTNIATVLRAEGHSVDVVINDYNSGTTNNARLQASLAGYDGVFWSATGSGSGSVHTAATMTNLTNYVSGGGRVFVTGYDTVASPTDPPLIGFLGGTGSVDGPAAPGAAAAVVSDLTTGVVDLRGVTPTGGFFADLDALTGVGTDTQIIVASAGAPTQGQWTLRTLGSGVIAYVSNGENGTITTHPSWTTTTAGGAGAYNGAVRNFAFHASGARVLFVSDSATDTNIPGVLQAEGHRVTTVINDYNSGTTNNARLQGSLTGFDVVVWSATGSGSGSTHAAATMTSLTAYVNGGGYVFVTGYDSIASPTDPPLIGFLGGTGSIDTGSAPGPVANVVNDLTTGRVDLRGVTPTGQYGDMDSLTGLGTDTTIVSQDGTTTGAGQWTLRTLGSGRIAYVSQGEIGPTSALASWTTTTAGGAGAYNGALRNFVFHASGARVLFVSDSATDTNIPDVLRGDGHRVTVVLNDFTGSANTRLAGSLAGVDVVVWSSTGGGVGDVAPAATITNLTNFVNAGGRVFVTGYDSIASPTDAPLIGFLGGTGSVDTGSRPGAIVSIPNDLNVGRVDLRGVTPSNAPGDLDSLTGYGAGVTVVTPVAGSTTEAQWLLRSLGAGRIAYVSNGDSGPTSANANWAIAGGGPTGAFNGAVRNFVHNYNRTTATAGAANGTACSTASECGSSFCVDGVCCNAACAGGTADCQACATAAGAAVNGTCGAVSSGRVCRASAGSCDVAETCNGTATACPADGFAPTTTACRASAGPCDVAENCSGLAATCPADAFAPTTTACRASAGPCDIAESCTGMAAACPGDGFAPSSTVCRAAATGGCDVAESCSGSSSACPSDVFAPATTTCRASAGPCDLAEACPGTGPACPSDAFAASSVVCRASTGMCDTAESCTGAGVTCPSDAFVANGSSCGDSLMCNGAETCQSGACAAGTALSCDDGDPCTTDSCSEPSGCSRVAIPGCGATDAGSDAGELADAADASDADDGSTDVADAGDDAAGADAGDDAAVADAAVTDAAVADAAVTDVAANDVAANDAAANDAAANDAAANDAAVAGDAGDDGGLTETPTGSSGCGCAVPGRTNARGPGLVALAGLVALLRARRRRAS